MDEIFHLAQRLQHYKITNPYDPEIHEPGRHTYCHLMIYIRDNELPYKEGWHKIEVRNHQTTMDYSRIELSAVSWTLAAGTCTISIDEINCTRFKILEDEPTLQVLYG